MMPSAEAILEAALSIRKRRFHLLLEEHRELRRSLQTARRSRQRRARLLGLARRHKLRLCLERLRGSGMSIAGGREPFFHYDALAVRRNRDGLLQRRREIRQRWGQLKGEPLDGILANLEALYEAAEPLDEGGMKVKWTMYDVYLDDVYIGDLGVTMALERFEVRVKNTSIDLDDKGGYHHPHVARDGWICWNGHDEEAEAYHAEGDFLAVKDMIEALLQTYNPHSPYISLENWEQGSGAYCSACEERCDEDELGWSQSYGGELCESCRAWCEKCDEYVHYTRFNADLEACESCIEAGADNCAHCGRLEWVEDLTEVEAPWFAREESLRLCSECLEEHEKTLETEKEEEHETNGEREFGFAAG
jgi:hypothetical protein